MRLALAPTGSPVPGETMAKKDICVKPLQLQWLQYPQEIPLDAGVQRASDSPNGNGKLLESNENS